jgi:hypothetical protein
MAAEQGYEMFGARFGALAITMMIGVIGSDRSASAQTISNVVHGKVQLYLVAASGITKKGHIKKEPMPASDGKVAFRDCLTQEESRIPMSELKPINGTCAGAEPPWNLRALAGYIIEVKIDGSVVFKFDDGKTMSVSAAQWQEGFTKQKVNTGYIETPPLPKVGEFVGGITYDNPQNFYLIENKKFNEIKG